MAARKSRSQAKYRAAQKARSADVGAKGQTPSLQKKVSGAQLQAQHAGVAARTRPHAWLGTSIVALVLGGLALLAERASFPDTTGGVVLATIAISALSVAVGVLTLLVADLVLGGRGWAETWSWAKSTEDARAVITANALIPAMITLLARLGYPPATMPYEALVSIGVFVAVWRSLSLAYRHQYLDRTLSANQRLFLDAERKERPRWMRAVFFVFGARALQERHRLILPFLQSYLVLLLPQLALIFYFPESVSALVKAFSIVSFPLLLVLSVWLWGRWHLFGGLGSAWSRLTGADTGRPLRPNV